MSLSASKDALSAAGRVSSGLYIITASGDGKSTGILASWVQQCGFEPLRLSLAVAKDRWVRSWLTPGSSAVVHVLGEGEAKKFMSHFGKGFGPDDDAFVGLDVEHRPGKPPLLKGPLVRIEGKVSNVFDAGDHDLVILDVESGTVSDEAVKPATHSRKSAGHY